MTDTELCLALARAMGKEAELVETGYGAGPDDVQCLTLSPSNNPIVFDPIRSGADFDAVFNWARKSMGVDWSYVCQEMEHWRNGPDPLFRRAVCAAIVEATAAL